MLPLILRIGSGEVAKHVVDVDRAVQRLVGVILFIGRRFDLPIEGRHGAGTGACARCGLTREPRAQLQFALTEAQIGIVKGRGLRVGITVRLGALVSANLVELDDRRLLIERIFRFCDVLLSRQGLWFTESRMVIALAASHFAVGAWCGAGRRTADLIAARDAGLLDLFAGDVLPTNTRLAVVSAPASIFAVARITIGTMAEMEHAVEALKGALAEPSPTASVWPELAPYVPRRDGSWFC